MPQPVGLIYLADLAAGGTTLRTYRNRLADQLGFYLETTVSAQGATGEATRVAIVDEIRDDEVDTTLDVQWLYVRSGDQAGQQRRILRDPEAGYQGPQGAVLLAKSFDFPLEAGTDVVLTGPLPVKRSGVTKGLDDCANEALQRIKILARLPIVGTAGYEYPLAAYDDFLTGDVVELLGISDRRGQLAGTSVDPPMASPYGYRIVSDGATHTLVTQGLYSATETFYLDVALDADRLIHDGIAWGYVGQNETTGLSSDGHRAVPPVAWVVAFAMVLALRQLDKMARMRNGVDPADRRMAIDDIASRRLMWARVAADIKQNRFPKPYEPPTRAFIGGTAVLDAPTIRPWI